MGPKNTPQDTTNGGPEGATPPQNVPTPSDSTNSSWGAPQTVDPSVSPPAPQAPVAPAIVPPKKKKTMMIALIIGIVLVVLGGGGAAAYFGYYLPTKPENILGQALANSFSLEKAKTAAFDGELTATSKAEDVTIKSTFKGASSADGAMDLSVAVDLFVATLTLDVRSVDGKSLFVRVGGLDGLPQLLQASGNESAALYVPLLESINNQWYEINESLLKGWTGAPALTLSQADLEKMAQAYKNNAFLKVTETLPSEKIKDVDSYHYKVVVDKEALKGFIWAVQQANIEGFKLTTEQAEAVVKVLDDSTADFSQYPFEVWIAKDTKLFTKFAFNYTDNELGMNFSINLFDYNKPVVVEKPEGAKSILEVMGEIFSNPAIQESLGGALPSDTGVSL